MDDDTIYRRMAIDALDEYIEEYSYDLDENGYHNPKWCSMQEAKMTIQRLPSAERRGKWIETLLGWRCSFCGEEQDYSVYFKHCPNCGAKMEGEEK